VATSAVPPGVLRFARGAAALGLTVAALTACGSDAVGAGAAAEATATTAGPAAGPSDAQVRSVTVTEVDFGISLAEDTLPAGTYEIEVRNEGGSLHDLVVARDGDTIAGTDGGIPPGGSGTVTVTLEPGEYVFFCSIANHRSMGMETTVEVTG
jgi:plastocyanin